MLGVYLFALGLGGVLLAATLFGDADAHDGSFHEHAEWQHLFSLRNATYFLFVFGLVGSALTWLKGAGTVGTAVAAAATGLFVSALVHAVFRYIWRTDSAEVAADSALVGLGAQVTLAIRADSLGKIELTLNGKRVELLARPFDAEKVAAEEIANGSEVLIVDVVGGMALVSRAPE